MPKAFWATLALTLAVFSSLHVEWRLHRRALTRLPIRVHVNGTRGKSSVTRLIAAALRAGGVRTVAKTTGTSARLILPDGSERPVAREGPPNIRELLWATRLAARLRAQAIVFECMAVDPDLQRVAEVAIVRPTITVLTNARLDHTDVQGDNERDIARAFAVRPGGTLVTADPLILEMQGFRTTASGGEVHLSLADSIRPEDLHGLAYIEHPENVAVALQAAAILGIPHDVALDGIKQALPDPGVASVMTIPHETGPWTLINLFAANDPQSTFRAMQTVQSFVGTLERPLLLFASRPDRTARSGEFARALGERRADFSKIVVWGERTTILARRARRHGVTAEQLIDAGSRSPSELTELLVRNLDDTRTVVGVGNIVGPAHRWLEYLGEEMEKTSNRRRVTP